MHPADIPKSTIITLFGLFEFLRLHFDLQNASHTFQRTMDRIFDDLTFCFIYLDDILGFSNSLEDHQLHLHHVLDLCRLQGLNINLEKYVFLLLRLNILDLLLSTSTFPPSLLFCHPPLPCLPVAPGGGEILQEVYFRCCSDPLSSD